MLENLAYCPTLHTRSAEMNALARLPAETKDKIFPLIVAGPRPNAKYLERTWEKIGDSLGNRRFALDLDPTKKGSDSGKPAAAEFDALFDSKGGFKNYYEAVAKMAQAIPVLRVGSGQTAQLKTQADRIDDLDRGVIFRIEFGAPSNSLEFIDSVLERFEDISIFVDAGWSKDILSRTAWASGIIERVTKDKPGAELVVSGSSFPDTFTNVHRRRPVPISERFLYNELVRQHNAAKLIYGDWGSTRPPPMDPTPMRNVPRIDLPKPGEWIVFRRDDEMEKDEDYQDIAKRVIIDPDWPKDLSIWGTNSINWTAKGQPGGITGPAAAAAARINIHLHRQAYYGLNDLIADGDEPFTDE